MTTPRSLLERLEALEADLPFGLIRRLKLDGLLRRFPARLVWAVFTFVNGFITIAILTALAMVSRTPFIFPSLGPTAFMFFFNPTAPAARPRNALYGHALGILCGYGALWITGLQHAPSTLAEGINGPRVLAAALSLSGTAAAMILFRVAHPPAGATTLIVSLGLITAPKYLLVIEVAVALLILQALFINRLAGLDYPLWSTRRHPTAARPAGEQRPRPK
jgi:CBS-domain-containing membrane protein